MMAMIIFKRYTPNMNMENQKARWLKDKERNHVKLQIFLASAVKRKSRQLFNARFVVVLSIIADLESTTIHKMLTRLNGKNSEKWQDIERQI